MGASRSFQHYRDVRSDFGAPEPESESFLGYPSVEFIIAAPACAIAATHEAVRDSHLLKHYAPLAPTVEAALVQPADEHAKDELESIDPGHFAYVDALNTFAATRTAHSRSCSWVLWSVDALECLFGLLSCGRVSLAELVSPALELESSTDFKDAEADSGRQSLEEWLDENADHFGHARIEKLVELCKLRFPVAAPDCRSDDEVVGTGGSSGAVDVKGTSPALEGDSLTVLRDCLSAGAGGRPGKRKREAPSDVVDTYMHA